MPQMQTERNVTKFGYFLNVSVKNFLTQVTKLIDDF